ncbi:DMT family transporter [Candidatus Dependentiae bacterium]|nr:DMT family transporter [Candidatus Dependentiae bacterium]
MFFIIALQALWASSIPLSKILLNYSSPIFLAGIRMLLAGILLLTYQFFFTQQGLNLQRKHFWFYAQIIFFGIYLKYILRYWGLVQLSTAKMSFMLNITPFCVALFSYFAFNEKLSKQKWMGLILGFSGLIPILFLSCPAENLNKSILFFSWAELAILAEIAAHSYALIVMRKMVRENYSAGMTNGIRMFGGGILALMTAFMTEGFMPVTNPITFSGYLTVLILLSNVICHNFYIYLLKYYSATFLAFTDFLSPIFVAFYGWLFLHEIITWHYYLSGTIVLTGLYLFYQDELSSQNSFIPAFISKWKRPTQRQEITINQAKN